MVMYNDSNLAEFAKDNEDPRNRSIDRKSSLPQWRAEACGVSSRSLCSVSELLCASNHTLRVISFARDSRQHTRIQWSVSQPLRPQ